MSYEVRTEQEFLSTCLVHCEDPVQTEAHQSYLEAVETDAPRLCSNALRQELFECGAPECGNGVCEYTERMAQCDDCTP